MTDFATDETSVQDSRPREAYEFRMGMRVFRLITGDQDQLVEGSKYTAEPVLRSEIVVSTVTNRKELEITLPVSHDIVRRYLVGVPPKKVTVIVRRLQLTSGQSVRIWNGPITAVSASGHTASLLVPSTMNDSLEHRLPTIAVGRQCPHILFDSGCKVNKNTFSRSGTITSISGRTVKVDLGGETWQVDYFKFGEILHPSSTETMTISSSSDTLGVGGPVTLEIQLPVLDFKVGDTVRVTFGCDHLIATCRDKFANQFNFGGFPHIRTRNPFWPFGLGVK